MTVENGSISHPADGPPNATDSRAELVGRVVSSATFEKSPKLRAFLTYVCRCAIENDPAAATEQQIGIHVFSRPPGYNPNEDNIVRSQARLLRLKLEHHFTHDGKDEATIIAIPKGRYLPVFEKRPPAFAPAAQPVELETRPGKGIHPGWLLVPVLLLALTFVWLVWSARRSKQASSPVPSAVSALPERAASGVSTQSGGAAIAPLPGEVRIAAGNSAGGYVDAWGRHWEQDQYYVGGVVSAGPADLFPPVPDPNLFKTMREGAPVDSMAPPARSQFRYEIPVPPGTYELRLYFADPIRRTSADSRQDAQNFRHFNVNANGRQLLSGYDSIADAGTAAGDVRAFKDITPGADGKVRLEFIPSPERPFVNAIELTPGTTGKLKAIRLLPRDSNFVDHDGKAWSADNYYIGGRTSTYANPDAGPKVPDLYTDERYGNFAYAIPVPAGSYTVKLHFLEAFFAPQAAPTGICRGVGCRVFDVTCNGTELLRDFDIYKVANGGFRPVVRIFQGLHPNGQGKLLLAFTPKVNYASVRAIEVIDEGK